MKKILTICAVLAVTLAPATAAQLRFAYFFPASGRIALYVQEDGFNRDIVVSLNNLTEDQQASISAALVWLAGALPEGFTSLDQVILEPGTPLPVTFDELNQPTAWERTLNAAITGSGPKGSRTITISGGDSPAEIRTGLLAIWDALEDGQNP